MQLSNYIIVAAIEIYAVLIAIGIFLLFHVRKQRRLVRRQQEKLQHLITELEAIKLPSQPTETNTISYKTHIANQRTATLSRYSGMAPHGDITSPDSPESSPPLYSLSLRYKFLEAEAAAIAQGDGPLQIDWQIFEDYLIKLCVKNEPAEADGELSNYKKRVENLEKFKQLFFDMEKNWLNAKSKAAEYYTQLSGMSEMVANKDLFNDVLNRYHNVYTDINAGFEVVRQGLPNVKQVETQTVHITQLNPQSNSEIIKLRNVAADQHRIIAQLQRKLELAVTAEAKEAVIGELKHQLQRQVRFVQESETCIQLLEEELHTANEKLHKYEQTSLDAAQNQHELLRAKEMLHNFTLESKDLMKDILNMKKENEMLKQNLIDSSEAADIDKSKALKNAQAEFTALQNQYVELEEKYLDLKLQK